MAKLKTGRHTGAIKTHRQSERRALRNRRIRKTIRLLAKEFQQATAKKDAQAIHDLSKKVASAWDKAAKAGVVHWKTVARRKSRLISAANAALKAPAAPKAPAPN